MDQKKFDEATVFNQEQLRNGILTAKHVTSMTAEWQQHHALEADGKAGPMTIGSIESVTKEALNTSKPEHPPAGQPPNFYDRRATASNAHVGGPRPITQVTGICLHQTACMLGENPPRWDSVGAHVGITRSGKIIWLHDFTQLVWHGNGWNNGTVGIEIDGLYAGIEGDPSTVWDDPTTPSHEQGMKLTPETVAATKAAIRWITSCLPNYNVLVAHRQSSMDRRNDPGSAIWKEIALPMHAEQGVSDGGVGFKLGGYAIPEAWDPRCTGIKY